MLTLTAAAPRAGGWHTLRNCRLIRGGGGRWLAKSRFRSTMSDFKSVQDIFGTYACTKKDLSECQTQLGVLYFTWQPDMQPSSCLLLKFKGVNPIGADGGPDWIQQQQSLFWMICLKFEFGIFLFLRWTRCFVAAVSPRMSVWVWQLPMWLCTPSSLGWVCYSSLHVPCSSMIFWGKIHSVVSWSPILGKLLKGERKPAQDGNALGWL